jgi:2-haloacid dehalogenase
MERLDKIEILTFDCYGTLIGVLGELAADHGLDGHVNKMLAEWEAIQFDLITGPWRPYREVLRESLDETFCRHCVVLSADEADLLADRVGTWLPFDDTREALCRLKERYRLAILSNIDDDLLAQSLARMEVSFDALITAEELKSYKPRLAHFEEAIRRFDAPADRFLHCAFGFKYDQAPARAVGMSTVWVKRPGWIRDAPIDPTYEVASLAELVELLGAE